MRSLKPGGPPGEEAWSGTPADQRWAMEVLGLRAGMGVARDDVNRRFRRMLRDAHPDSGGATGAAAARIAELTEARGILLGAINHLPEQERLVVALYYYEELTLKEIGEILGISESRVSQVHTKAIRRLRRRVPELAA